MPASRSLLRLLMLALLALLLSGCAAPSAPPNEGAEGAHELELLSVEADMAYEADALCANGGGPRLPRDGDARVGEGSAGIRVDMRVDPTFTSLQVGHVTTDRPGRDESSQPGITWLPATPGGEDASFVIPVRDAYERADGPLLWHFYYRMQTPVPTACYAGGGTGRWSIVATLVPATPRA